MNAIRTTLFQPKADNPASLEYVRQRSIQEVQAQIEEMLRDTPFDEDSSAHDCMEWISPSVSGDFPDGEPVALMRHGNCEGYLIEILCLSRPDNRYLAIFTIKYLTNKDAVTRITAALGDALYDGLFGYQ